MNNLICTFFFSTIFGIHDLGGLFNFGCPAWMPNIVLFISFFKDELKGEAEAEEVERDDWRVVAADRNSAVPGNADPVATTDHAAGGRDVVAGVIGRRLTVILFVIPVLTPFQYVAAHVVDAQFIGLFLTHRVGLFATVVTIPRH